MQRIPPGTRVKMLGIKDLAVCEGSKGCRLRSILACQNPYNLPNRAPARLLSLACRFKPVAEKRKYSD